MLNIFQKKSWKKLAHHRGKQEKKNSEEKNDFLFSFFNVQVKRLEENIQIFKYSNNDFFFLDFKRVNFVYKPIPSADRVIL